MSQLSAEISRYVGRYQRTLLIKSFVLAALIAACLFVLGLRLESKPTRGVLTALAVSLVLGVAYWLRLRWLSRSAAVRQIDDALDLKQRLLTVSEFEKLADPPALYHQLLEDTRQRIERVRQQLPRPLDRKTIALAIALLLLLLLPWKGTALIQLAQMLPPTPQPASTPPPEPQPGTQQSTQPEQPNDRQQPSPQQQSGQGQSPKDSQPQSKPEQGQGESGDSQEQQSKDSKDERDSKGGKDSEGDKGSSDGNQSREQSSQGDGSQQKDQQEGSGEQSQDTGQEQGGKEPDGSQQDQKGGSQKGQSSSRDAGSDGRDRAEGERSKDQNKHSGEGQQAQPAQAQATDRPGQGEKPGKEGARRGDQASIEEQAKKSSGQGQSPGGQEALREDIQELLKEMQGELREIQAQLEQQTGEERPSAGQGTDPDLYGDGEKPAGVSGNESQVPLQLETDSERTESKRKASGVGSASDEEVSTEGPSADREAAFLAEQPLEETAGERRAVPPEYQSVFESLYQRTGKTDGEKP